MRAKNGILGMILALLLLGGSALAGEMGGSYMGVDVQDVSSDRVAALKLKDERGAEITMVDTDAPAGKAGLKEHDVILSFNGATIESVEQLRRLIRETPPGRNVALTVSRDGQVQSFNLQLADRKKVFAFRKPHIAPMPAMPPMAPRSPMPPMDRILVERMMFAPSRVGIELESLTPQLGEFFGVKSGEGVLVRSVEKGSPAETAGFKAGDVIVKIGEDRVTDRSDWRSALRRKSGKLAVVVVREKKEQTLTLTVPERKQSGAVIFGPDGDFDFDFDFERLAQLQPMIERATRLALLKAGAELKKNKVQIERELRKAHAEVEKELAQQEKELEKEQKEVNKQPK